MKDLLRSVGLAPMTSLAILILGVTGCGEVEDGLPREAISGTVTLDGQPLTQGMIQLLPASRKEGVAGGALIKDGKFALERDRGLVPGEYRVVVNSSLAGNDEGTATNEPPGPTTAASVPKDMIPPKYNEKSTLTAEVKAGTANSFDFALTTK